MMTIASKNSTILSKMMGLTNLYHQLFVRKLWPKKSAIFAKKTVLAFCVGFRDILYETLIGKCIFLLK